MKHWKG